MDLDQSDDSETHCDSENDSDSEEVWDDTLGEHLDEDILNPLPIPEPVSKKKFHTVHFLLQWMLYFLLIWQSITNLSDNGLTWLLQSLFHFLQALNIHIPDEILAELIAVFLCSLYMARKYLNINTDNLTKHVVCPKCYNYDECLRKAENGIIVTKCCSNVSFSRGKAVRCNSKLVKKVVLKDNQIKYYPVFYYCYNGIINCLEEIVSRKGVPESWE